MTEEERKTIKQKIRADIEALRERIAALEFSIQQLPDPLEVDPTTRAEMMNHRRNCQAGIRDAMKKVSQLEVALKRVDGPDYGICIECEKPIEMTKLMLMPETLYCVQCHKL